jgi:TonB-dependent SusC/RagA subfamily outer membrane receptor
VELSSVDPGSIDSITVLKAAEAAATFGFQGVDGAIIVTTKRPSAP